MRTEAAYIADQQYKEWAEKLRHCELRYQRKTSLALARAAYRAAKGEPPPRSGRNRLGKTSKVKAGKVKEGKAKGMAAAGVARGAAGSRRVAARRPG